ncbi:hypothetical protein C2S51_015400 [Perilla frutescens var. frutescens]|nr:hypothetical protein C2S51_015400 [Perilla frutescens var. frutescens]
MEGADGSHSEISALGDSREIAVCPEHLAADRYVSKSHSHPFRRFIRCPDREVSGCTFRRWVDAEMPPYQKTRVQRLMLEKETAGLRLQCKELLVDVLYEKMRLKDAELARLRGQTPLPQIAACCFILLLSLCILVYA